jgi:hypothetical protein
MSIQCKFKLKSVKKGSPFAMCMQMYNKTHEALKQCNLKLKINIMIVNEKAVVDDNNENVFAFNHLVHLFIIILPEVCKQNVYNLKYNKMKIFSGNFACFPHFMQPMSEPTIKTGN